jgi:hypothetical protein
MGTERRTPVSTFLRTSTARPAPLSTPAASYTAAVERYLTGAGTAKSSARIYRISPTAWGRMLVGGPAPTGPARRGAKPPAAERVGQGGWRSGLRRMIRAENQAPAPGERPGS